MNTVRVPLPKPVDDIRMISHSQPGTVSDNDLQEFDQSVYQGAELSQYSDPAYSIPADVVNGNSNGDDIKIKTLKHRVFYLEKSLQIARDEAFKAGFTEAERIYLDRQSEELETLNTMFSRTLDELQKEFQDLPNRMAPVITDIILQVARRIVGDILEDNQKAESVVSHQIQRCLNQLTDQQEIRIAVSPDQYQWVNKDKVLSSLQTGAQKRIHIAQDPSLLPGECRVESEDYVLDATLERQLNNIRLELSSGMQEDGKSPHG